MNPIEEGLADYELDREEADAREEMLRWAVAVADPCCHDCGWLSYARENLRAALRRARAAGVFEDQPGEVDWFAAHRADRSLDLDEMYLSVDIGHV